MNSEGSFILSHDARLQIPQICIRNISSTTSTINPTLISYFAFLILKLLKLLVAPSFLILSFTGLHDRIYSLHFSLQLFPFLSILSMSLQAIGTYFRLILFKYGTQPTTPSSSQIILEMYSLRLHPRLNDSESAI